MIKYNAYNLITYNIDDEIIKIAVIDTGSDLSNNVQNINLGFFSSLEDESNHGRKIIDYLDKNIGDKHEIISLKIANDDWPENINCFNKALEWCIRNKVDIINISMSTNVNDITTENLFLELKKNGVIVIAAAGNNYGGKVRYPARYGNVISVGVDEIHGDNYSALKGVDIFIHEDTVNNCYEEAAIGTSFAAPIVLVRVINYIEKRDIEGNITKNELISSLDFEYKENKNEKKF